WVIGLHFFAPANIMRLLEVVRGAETSDAVIATGMALGRKLGKIAVLSGVCDGFIANRVMAQRMSAAEALILEGPLPWDVDRVMNAYGFPMGPFQMIDLVGLDVIGWDRENSAGRSVQELLCEMDRWGQKKAGGYYDYDESRRASPSAVAEQVIRDFAARTAVPQRAFTDAEIVERLLYPVVNEGAKVLEEGIALRASDIDVALVTGYGWPVWTGGPMFWADSIGLPAIVATLDATIGAEAVSPLLRKLAAEGGRLTD
ncbi:MAG TPA: 3-hydroxyacyl-CoA dehydrogenase family protein, partial [Sphingobium sp.]